MQQVGTSGANAAANSNHLCFNFSAFIWPLFYKCFYFQATDYDKSATDKRKILNTGRYITTYTVTDSLQVNCESMWVKLGLTVPQIKRVNPKCYSEDSESNMLSVINQKMVILHILMLEIQQIQSQEYLNTVQHFSQADPYFPIILGQAMSPKVWKLLKMDFLQARCPRPPVTQPTVGKH